MKHSRGFRIILTAMFASMVCVSTLFIQIASPMGGYINLGDALVLMSAFMLGPVYGTAAAGIGSALADVFTGYVIYAPGTLIIKAGIALIAAAIAGLLRKHAGRIPPAVKLAIAGIPGEIFMVLGYLAYAWFPLGYGPAAVSTVPGNLLQGAAGVVIAALLTPMMTRPHEIRDLLEKFHAKKQ